MGFGQKQNPSITRNMLATFHGKLRYVRLGMMVVCELFPHLGILYVVQIVREVFINCIISKLLSDIE